MTKKIRVRYVGAVALVALTIAGAAACDPNDHRGKGDAPVYQRKGDDSAAFVTNMPDGFGNVSAKCLYGFPGEAAITNTEKITMVFKYAGCDGKKHAPDASVGAGN
jgi:flavoprotein